jgi:hypothetical protein
VPVLDFSRHDLRFVFSKLRRTPCRTLEKAAKIKIIFESDLVKRSLLQVAMYEVIAILRASKSFPEQDGSEFCGSTFWLVSPALGDSFPPFLQSPRVALALYPVLFHQRNWFPLVVVLPFTVIAVCSAAILSWLVDERPAYPKPLQG